MQPGEAGEIIQVNFIRMRSSRVVKPFTSLLPITMSEPYHLIQIETIYESVLPIHDEFKLQLNAFNDLKVNASLESKCQEQEIQASTNILLKYSCTFKYQVPTPILIKSRGYFGLTTSDML